MEKNISKRIDIWTRSERDRHRMRGSDGGLQFIKFDMFICITINGTRTAVDQNCVLWNHSGNFHVDTHGKPRQ